MGISEEVDRPATMVVDEEAVLGPGLVASDGVPACNKLSVLLVSRIMTSLRDR